MFTKHPWHGVSHDYEAGLVTGVVEISRGQKAKYEIDKDSGLLKLDRILYSSMVYPMNYGFFPMTLGEDGDPLDMLLISQVDIEPLCLVRVRILGMLEMIDRNQGDHKIICVLNSDPYFSLINDIRDFSQALIDEIQQFFALYTSLEKKAVQLGNFVSKEKAVIKVLESIDRYKSVSNS